ncbi:MAG: hypothetical protein LC746_06965 [Acidobacteria bacterium]|nr:hypothetical protein [Acidobacteriota bacterium]
MLVGVAYFVVGFGFALIATPPVSGRMWFAWRLAAWVASAAMFAAHVGYEHFRLGSSPLATARHAATAVAFGAFLLAVAATVHAATVASHAPYRRFALALVVWPVVTALPAFLVALVLAAVLARLPTKRLAD